MNYQDMADFVRAQADTDVEDAPDATLRVYAGAAYKDILRRVYPWPDKKMDFQFVTVPGQAFYGYAEMTAPDLEYVNYVWTPSQQLGYVSPEQGVPTLSNGQSGDPKFYMPGVTGLWLFPTPTTAFSVGLTGYRKFADWPVATPADPDLPRGFDEVICWYMLSKYYAAQEDLELMQAYAAQYEMDMNRQIEAALRGSATTAGPRIFGNQSLENVWVPVFPNPVIQVGS